VTGAMKGVFAVAVAAVIFSACGDTRRSAGEWAGQVDTLASGRLVVRNPATPLWDSTEAWRLTEDLRIGRVEGEGPEVFGRIAGLVVDRDGRLWALDRQARELKIFAPDGAHMRTIGRQGGGPGEFGDPIGLAQDSQGRMWVADPANARFSVHDSTGEFIETRRRAIGGYSVPWRGGFDADGRLWEAAVVRGESGIRRAILRFDEELNPRDTLLLPDVQNAQVFELRTQAGSVSANVPFTPTQLWAKGAGNDLWIGSSGEYRLHLTRGGDTLRTVERAFESVPVTSAERQEAIDNLEWFVQQGGRVDESRIPGTKPILQRFSVDPDGYLWVLVTPRDGDQHPFDIFDPDGRYLGRVDSPVAFQPWPIFQVDAVHGLHTDELGVQQIVRARLWRPDR
jgi:hypothetical protein